MNRPTSPQPGAGSRKGVTLIELLVALAIAGMLLAIAFPSASGGLEGIRLQAAARRVAAYLNAASLRANREQAPIQITVDAERNRLSAVAVNGRWEESLALDEAVRLVAQEDDRPRRFMVIPGVPAPRVRIRLATARGRSVAVSLDPITGTPRVEEEAR